MIHEQFEEISSNELMNFGGISVEFHHSIMFTHENVSVKFKLSSVTRLMRSKFILSLVKLENSGIRVTQISRQ